MNGEAQMFGLSTTQLAGLWMALIGLALFTWVILPQLLRRHRNRRPLAVPPLEMLIPAPRRRPQLGKIYLSSCAPLRREVIDDWTANHTTVMHPPLSDDEAAIIYELGKAAERARQNGRPGA